MGVYIRGMEMPKDYSVIVKIFPDGRVGAIYSVQWFKVSLIPGTQAVPVPPHGDLIERKAISLTDFEIAMCCGDYKEGMKVLLEKTESAPTIIPAEGASDEN